MQQPQTLSPFAGLPEALLRTLGRRNSLTALTKALQLPAASQALLRKHTGDEVCRVAGSESGLLLALQPLESDADAGPRSWGVQSFTLDASQWEGGWPEGVDPDGFNARELVAAFGVLPDEALLMPGNGLPRDGWATCTRASRRMREPISWVTLPWEAATSSSSVGRPMSRSTICRWCATSAIA